MAERKRLSDILLNSEKERLERAWSTVAAAGDTNPLPTGNYRCRIVRGELFTSRGGKLGYKLTLEVLDGEYTGHRAWYDIWLTDAAISWAKRDLARLQIISLDQLDRPLPDGIIVVAKIVLRRNDDRTEYNKVENFKVVAVEPPTPEPFAPKGDGLVEAESTDTDGFDWQAGEQRNGVPTQ
jgi:uncharacterized protein DUF669